MSTLLDRAGSTSTEPTSTEPASPPALQLVPTSPELALQIAEEAAAHSKRVAEAAAREHALPRFPYGPDLESKTNREVQALIENDPFMFRQGASSLVRLNPDATKIEQIPGNLMRHIVGERVRFVTILENTDPSVKLAPKDLTPVPTPLTTFLAATSFSGARPLTKIVTTPQLLENKTWHTAPGYRRYGPDLGCYLNPAPKGLAVRLQVTPTEAAASLARLYELVDEFPFASEADKSGWVALVLTLLFRMAFPCAPIFVIGANRNNSGKTLLLNAASMLALGQPASITPCPENEAEMTKQATSWALDAVPLVALDNTDGDFGSPVLEGIATSSGNFNGRILGRNSTAGMPLKAVLVVTGNNLTFSRPDTVRRVLPVMLEVKSETKPTYKIRNLLKHIERHRARLLQDAIDVVACYVKELLHVEEMLSDPYDPNGYRAQVDGLENCTLDSFEEMSELICGAIVWAGGANPLDAKNGLQEGGGDSYSVTFRQFFEGVEEILGGTAMTAAEIMTKALPSPAYGLQPKPGDELRAELLAGLRESFGALGMGTGKTGIPTAQELGIRLQKFSKVPFKGKAICLKTGSTGANRYWIRKVTP